MGSGAGIKTESDDSSSDENKSDNAERSFAKLTLQNKTHSKFLKQKLPMQSVVESDSFNELFGGCSQAAPAETKRRRRHKRMAVDASELSNKEWGESSGLASVAAVIPKRSDMGPSKSKKKVIIADPQVSIDFGKRKRGHRDRPVESTSGDTSYTNDKTNRIDSNYDYMDEDMNSDQDDTSSVFSSSESDDFHITCDEGQEGDDEQSDWVGEEWLADDGVDSEERRRDLIMRRLRSHSPTREIRAGKRRVHPHKPVFSFRTSANEQLSKFLQDPEQLELKLHPMRKSERVQLSHIASLYSLQMHYRLEDDGSEKSFTCPILTKTSNTAQMDLKSADEESTRASWLGPLWIESDSKRIKK
ncbi:unnamed protein product [Allacma fusca]|uniref:Uncharacterized protein n=1 Tax=Allacma fusca TaxID=39272 RepID=A0A8J2PVL8_9HEXA|nr:unnamed protein product [Allacma fusca]